MNSLRRYFQPDIFTVLLMGFASGLPRLLVAGTLAARLNQSGLSMSNIGLFALVSLPYSFHALWAPLIDHLPLPLLTRWLGQRRGWIFLLQILLVMALIGLAYADPLHNLPGTAFAAAMVAFLSASQDVVINAYRAERLEKSQYGEGAAVAVFGYRVGMLAAGAGALAMADHIDWHHVYLVMAALMAASLLITLCSKEPEVRHSVLKNVAAGTWFAEAVLAPFRQFAQKQPHWLLIVILIVCFRLPDGFIATMSTPFLQRSGFSNTEIATVSKLWGFGATILGTFIGGSLVAKLGLWRSMFIFTFFQVAANSSYLLLSVVGNQTWALVLAVTADNLSGGASTSAAIAFLMGLTDPRYTATQYALLDALASLATVTIAAGAGFVAEHYGFTAMFLLSGCFGVPAIFLLWHLRGHPAFLPQKATD